MATMLNPNAIPNGSITQEKIDPSVLEGKQDKTAIVTETEGLASYAISPNVLTKLGTLASSVTLSLDTASEQAGVSNVYDIIFSTPAAAPKHHLARRHLLDRWLCSCHCRWKDL